MLTPCLPASASPPQVGAPLRPVTVRDAIADLPEIENGHMVEEMEYVGGPVRTDVVPLTVPPRLSDLSACAAARRPGVFLAPRSPGPPATAPELPPGCLPPVPLARRCLLSSSTCAATAPS